MFVDRSQLSLAIGALGGMSLHFWIAYLNGILSDAVSFLSISNILLPLLKTPQKIERSFIGQHLKHSVVQVTAKSSRMAHSNDLEATTPESLSVKRDKWHAAHHLRKIWGNASSCVSLVCGHTEFVVIFFCES